MLGALATALVSSALGMAAALAAPSGSLADWRTGQWWVEATGLRAWHAQGLTGKGVTIALLDGPVATAIPELRGQDVRPTGTICDRPTTARWGPTTPDGPLDQTSVHSTSMAALLVGNGRGNGPGGVGVLGVAPGATLKTYAVFNSVDPAAGQNYDCDGAEVPGLIDRIVADGADIVEIPVSLEATGDEVQAAVNRAVAKGVVIVTAAGNGGPGTRVMSPGGNAGVLVVGGMRPDGSAFSGNPTSVAKDWGAARTVEGQENIHLIAPGVDVVGGGLTAGGRWDSTTLQSGSSDASAIVAGQLALMRQRWPGATRNQLLYSLLRTAARPAGSPVWEARRGFGATSFPASLTTDPTAYPDVLPFYRTMANVYSDHPTAPFVPLTVDGENHVLPGEVAAHAALAVPGFAGMPDETGPFAWLVWLVVAGLAVAVLVGGGWALTRNRGLAVGVDTDDTATPAAGRRESVVPAGGPPVGPELQGEERP